MKRERRKRKILWVKASRTREEAEEEEEQRQQQESILRERDMMLEPVWIQFHMERLRTLDLGPIVLQLEHSSEQSRREEEWKFAENWKAVFGLILILQKLDPSRYRGDPKRRKRE
jgi:hypothetical protein